MPYSLCATYLWDVAKLVFADFDFELHNDDIAGRVLLLKVFDFVVGHHHTLY